MAHFWQKVLLQLCPVFDKIATAVPLFRQKVLLLCPVFAKRCSCCALFSTKSATAVPHFRQKCYCAPFSTTSARTVPHYRQKIATTVVPHFRQKALLCPIFAAVVPLNMSSQQEGQSFDYNWVPSLFLWEWGAPIEATWYTWHLVCGTTGKIVSLVVAELNDTCEARIQTGCCHGCSSLLFIDWQYSLFLVSRRALRVHVWVSICYVMGRWAVSY